jgi:hypothetical protein
MFKKFRLVIVFCIVAVGLLSISCYAGIGIKPHGGEVLNPELSYIVSETVVEDGRLISDKILCTDYSPCKPTKPSAPPEPSKISKVIQRWGIRLLDMFVCNVDDY